MLVKSSYSEFSCLALGVVDVTGSTMQELLVFQHCVLTTMPELLQPVYWLLHACHGCYNQMSGCNN